MNMNEQLGCPSYHKCIAMDAKYARLLEIAKEMAHAIKYYSDGASHSALKKYRQFLAQQEDKEGR